MKKNKHNHKGKNNPFYGKHHTEETKNKNRIAHYKKGKSRCIDCKKQLSSYGTKRCSSCHWKWIHKNNKKIIINLLKNRKPRKSIYKKYYCIDCKKQLAKNACYYNTKRCYSCAHRIHTIGKLNPNWRGGLTKIGYSWKFNKQLKESIRKRDNYTCQKCRMTEEEHLIVYGRNLEIHHIDYNKKNCKENNLITLCLGCNIRANYNRAYWTNFYKKKVTI